MPCLLTLRLDDEVLSALRRDGATSGFEVTTEAVPSLWRRLEDHETGEIAGVVVGKVEHPVQTVQRTRMAAPDLTVLLVRPSEECSSLREVLQISPFVSGDVRCFPDRPADSAVAAIRSAVERGVKRLRHQQTIHRLNRQLAEGPADRKLSSATAMLGRLLDIAPIGVTIIDAKGAVEALNPRARELLARPEPSLLRHPLWHFFAPEDQQRLRGLLDRLNGDPSAQPHDLFVLDAGGPNPRYLEITGAKLGARTGGPGHLVILQDVTERAELVEQLRASNRRKDEFLAMLGHELRNPMAPIRTAVDILRLRGASGMERELELIDRHMKRLVELVDDLLDVARITRGNLSLRKEPCEVRAFVGEAVEMVSPLFAERAVALQVDQPEPTIVVDGDPYRLGQVISNLLTNAAKNTERGGRVAVSVRREGDEVLIAVSDTGCGIAPELLPRIFEMFVQDQQSIDRAAGGLGLGLALVRSLVELHGGNVSVTSEVGRGSRFVVRLPALPVGELPPPPRDA